MEFGKKLDFLMTITGTTNSALAHSISLDASYISRLRNSKRTLPQKANFPRTMAIYFVKRFHDDQHKIFLDSISKDSPAKVSQIGASEELLYHWLVDQYSDLDDMKGLFNERFFLKAHQEDSKARSMSKPDITMFYGIDGKREAVLLFLESVLGAKTPQTLYLSSDEEMDWLGDDPRFLNRWADLMQQVIAKGNTITIIHTLNRDLDEMFTAIQGWIPLYMTGAVTAHYYPKRRDSVFKRTLFIAPKTAAIISTSVGDMGEMLPCTLINNKKAIAGFKKEYDNYLSLCKPLVKAFTKHNSNDYNDLLALFIAAPGSQLIVETQGYIFFIKEDMGIILGNPISTIAVFINESNATAVLSDYFNSENKPNTCPQEQDILLNKLKYLFQLTSSLST